MKIGIDGRAAKWYRGSGIGNYTYQLLNNLRNIDDKNEYFIVWPDNCNNDIILANKFNINYISEQHDKFWEQIIIQDLIIQNDLDLYHVPQNGIGLPLSKKCRYIITLHDIIPFKLPETVGSGYLQIFREYVPKIVNISDAIITVSNFSKNDICSYFNIEEDKVFVTYLAPEEIYKPTDKDICFSVLKEKFNINYPFILYVGGFSLRKNLMRLIKAFSIVRQKYDIHLIIPGKLSRNFPDLYSLTNNLSLTNYIHFLSFVSNEDLLYLYNAAYLFVYPSLYEGFGLPPLEAMSCMCPAVVSNKTSLPEILQDSVLYIDPYCEEDIVEKIELLIQNPHLREYYSKKGFEHAQKFNWKETVNNTINIYHQILALK